MCNIAHTKFLRSIEGINRKKVGAFCCVTSMTLFSVMMEKVPEVGLYKLGYRRIKNGVSACYEMNTIKMVDNNGTVTDASRSEFLEKLSLKHIREDGEDYSFTYEKLTDHGIIYLQARVSFVHEKDGGLMAVIGTRNVDDLIKKERQQEMARKAAFDAAETASRAKTDFLSHMSHDIRIKLNLPLLRLYAFHNKSQLL